MAKKRIQHKKKPSKSLKYIPLFLILSCGIYFSAHYVYNFFSYINNSIYKFIGFSVDHINISGANQKTHKLVFDNIGISKGDSIFKLSTPEIFNNTSKVTWIKSAIVQKILPNTINIKIKEKLPIAIFQKDSNINLIDEDGNFIEKTKTKLPGIPIVSGENANTKVKYILELISKYKDLRNNLDSLTYIRERRWNITISGLKILLPETEIEKALEILSIILKNGKINKNTVNYIDLRVPENVIFSKLKLIDTKNIL